MKSKIIPFVRPTGPGHEAQKIIYRIVRKKICVIILLLLFCKNAKAQIISIPDSNFKQKLVRSDANNGLAKDLSGNYFKIDANADGEIQLSEALQVSELQICCIHQEYISSLEGISNFSNLAVLNVSFNILTSLDVSGLTNLKELYCRNNGIAGIHILSLSNCNSLEILDCGYNSLTELDVSDCPNLTQLDFKANELTSLDVSGCSRLDKLYCQGNNLVNLNIQNSSNESSISIYANPNLAHICADASQISALEASVVQFNYDCSVDASCLLKTYAFENDSDLVIFPNPANDILKIQSKGKIAAIAVYNNLGQLVLSASDAKAIDVSTLAAGNYLVRAVSGNGMQTRNFIKK